MKGKKEIYIAQPVLRNNRQLIPKKYLFRKERKETLKPRKGELQFKEVSTLQLEKCKKKIQREAFIRNSITKVVGFLVCISIAIAMFLFFQSTVKYEQKEREEKQQKYKELHQPKYDYYIADGNKWLQKGHYKNARFQFKKALALFPEDPLAKERIRVVQLKSNSK